MVYSSPPGPQRVLRETRKSLTSCLEEKFESTHASAHTTALICASAAQRSTAQHSTAHVAEDPCTLPASLKAVRVRERALDLGCLFLSSGECASMLGPCNVILQQTCKAVSSRMTLRTPTHWSALSSKPASRATEGYEGLLAERESVCRARNQRGS